MARFRRKPVAPPGGAVPRESQLSLLAHFDGWARRQEAHDPAGPAARLFAIVLALSGLGLLMQASHAATTLPPDAFRGVLFEQVAFRGAALLVLLAAARIGPHRLRPCVPALCVLATVALVLVFVPPFADPRNGANRWVRLPLLGIGFQPSELARIVMVLWVADRCLRLRERVRDMRRGVLPMLFTGLALFALILVETDLGGAILFLLCFLGTMWVGGARPVHVYGSLVAVGGGAFLLVVSFVGYVRRRLEMWLGDVQNDQVSDTLAALGSGELWGVGFTHGLYRNAGVPYLESDYVFALVGEELGLVGSGLLVALWIAFLWTALRLVLSIRDRYAALVAFGLLVSVGLQAMLHVQVVTGLAPPKGMTLPFLSHGGTSLVVSSLAVGLALGAARPRPGEATALPAAPEFRRGLA